MGEIYENRGSLGEASKKKGVIGWERSEKEGVYRQARVVGRY